MSKHTASLNDRKAAATKPEKPRPDFPLFPHATGKWAKTIRGRTYYFGRWEDPHGAERDYLAVADDLHAGREPSGNGHASTGITLRELCNAFIKVKKTKMEAGGSPRTYVDYDRTCRMLLDQFGLNRCVADLRPSNFEKMYADLASKHSITSLGGHVNLVRSVFKYGVEADLIDRPVKFGPLFKAPGKTDIRKAKAKLKHKHGSRVFEAEQIRWMLNGKTETDKRGKQTSIEGANMSLRAMILLGINCAMGNTDIARLPLNAVNLKIGWIDYPRVKTGVERRIPLWPETSQALREVVAARREPADPVDDDLVFLTRLGQPWVRYEIEERKEYGKVQVTTRQDDAIAKATGVLLRELKIKRPGLSFYSLRHTFETIAGGCRDQVAVDSIMGHADSSMAGNYRHKIDDDRLRAAVDHVRRWLFGEGREGNES